MRWNFPATRSSSRKWNLRGALCCIIFIAVSVLCAGDKIAELRANADNGNTEAQYELGWMYANGEGVTKDPAEAFKWYHRAAEQGNGDAQHALGNMYAGHDPGVVTDPVEAARWYRRAAEQGNSGAQVSLGTMYLTGSGVTRDLIEAVRWYRLAAEEGYAKGENFLGSMYANGTGVAKDPAEAFKWYRRSAEQGDADGQVHVGAAYANGRGIAKNPSEAAKWFRYAAEQGDPSAQYYLGVLYEDGEGLPRDEIEALAWYNVSAAHSIWRVLPPNGPAEDRDRLEGRLGTQAALIAQQRSKEILKEIESKKVALGAKDTSTRSHSPPSKNDLPKSSGSGAIVSASGYVLTAAHVVAAAENVTVITAQGAKSATVVRLDEANDLALLKIDGGTYAALPVSPSRRVRLGQNVATIGFPNIGIQGFSPKLTRGEISSANGYGDDPRGWQISVPVQPGNSGGPLLDEAGNLIGIIVAKLGQKAAKITGDVPQNVNYAVKSAYALALLEPYLDASAPEPNQSSKKPGFEDMVAKAQQSVVLILVY